MRGAINSDHLRIVRSLQMKVEWWLNYASRFSCHYLMTFPPRATQRKFDANVQHVHFGYFGNPFRFLSLIRIGPIGPILSLSVACNCCCCCFCCNCFFFMNMNVNCHNPLDNLVVHRLLGCTAVPEWTDVSVYSYLSRYIRDCSEFMTWGRVEVLTAWPI